MKHHRLLAAATALCLTFAPMAANAYSALYVFGDSLSDAGNVFLGTSGAEPAPPYFNGEFSNGPNWVEGLSARLGLGVVAPSLAGGTDYAFGSATTGYSGTLSSPSLVPTVAQQVGLFLANVGGVAPSSGLYAVWIGSNDVLNIIESGSAGATALAQAAAATEAAAIGALAAHGATNFLVPLVGDLGTTPTLRAISPLAQAAGTALSQIYDAALQSDLASLAATPGITLQTLDTFSLLDSAVANPGLYNLTNVTDACYVGPFTGGGTACATPNQYLFWDQLHPSETGQALVALAAYNEVPEPATLALLGAGLTAMAGLRRRRSGHSVRQQV